MGYVLGIDLGTTYSAAAVSRDGGPVEVCTLGAASQAIPSVVVLREDGEILTGDAAERRAATEPTRTAKEFKRRLGDPVPLIIGTTPYGAEALMGFLLRAIVASVSEREGSPPDVVVLTHPANYSDYKRGLLEEAARSAGLDLARVRLLTEPQAAAVAYASQRRVEPGEVVAVYDFGGGTFDAAVVRKDEAGFTLLGNPEGMDRLGGIDIDQAVLAHVDHAVDGMVSGVDRDDPAARSGVVRLREDVRLAKEALSTDTDATIAVSLPGLQTDVRITRDELEAMIRPRVAETVDALRRAVASAGLAMSDVSRVLLVGGSSRIPLVGLLVRELTERPVAVDAHPKLAIATGAALSAADEVSASPAAAGPVSPATPVAEAPAPAPPTGAGGASKAALAGAAGAAFAATAGGAAIVGGLSSTAAGAETAAAAGLGPAGVPLAAGPTGAPLAAGPAGAPVAAGPGGVPVAPASTVAPPAPGAGSAVGKTVTAAAKKSKRLPIAVAAGAGVAAAVVAVAVVASQGGNDPTPSAATTSVVAAAPTTEATAGSSTTAAAGAAARGVDGPTAIIAGLRNDNSGKGAPGAATAISVGAPANVVVGPDGSAFVLDSAHQRVLRIHEGQATVAYEDAATIGGLAVSPTGHVVLLTTKGLVEITGDGKTTPVATLAELGDGVGPGSQTPLAFDGAGNLYLGNSNRYRVLRRAVDGSMSLVAGNGEFGGVGPPKGDGGAATAAPIGGITALVVDGKGNLLIGEKQGVLRKVATDGTLSTIAGAGSTKLGTATNEFVADGTPAADVDLAEIDALVVDGKGRVYVGDSLSGAIMRIGTDGTVEFVAGDQPGTAEPSVEPKPANRTRVADANGLAFEKSGALLVSEAGVLLRIERVASS